MNSTTLTIAKDPAAPRTPYILTSGTPIIIDNKVAITRPKVRIFGILVALNACWTGTKIPIIETAIDINNNDSVSQWY